MKKLIIAVAVAVLAIASQAAQMKWGSGTLYVPETTTKLSGSYGATASLYSLTAEQYAALESAISTAGLTKANDISKYLYDTYKGKTATKTGSFMSGGSTITESTSYAKGDTAYAVVIYSTYDNTSKTGDLYYIANMGKAEFAADSTVTLGGMGTNLGGGTGSAMAWQSVPEPTSGLLMLLGIAGLALRRRRA